MELFGIFQNRISAFIFLAILISAGVVQGQEIGGMPVPVVNEESGEKVKVSGRDGFTLLLTMGLGLQKIDSHSDSNTGLGGLNLGIGGFVSRDLAVLFRISGTNVQSNRPWERSRDLVSGVSGIAAQYWASDSFNFEAGLGMGFLDAGSYSYGRGYGLILGGAFSFYHGDTSSLQLGIEFAPVFLDNETIYNLCFAFGWQLL
jgi:hypothetical protein